MLVPLSRPLRVLLIFLPFGKGFPMILIRNACTIPGILIALVLGLSIAPVRAQSTLRYRFEQGQKLHYVVETKSVLSVSAGNLLRPRVDTTVTETIDLSWNVLSVNKQGLARIAQKVVRLRYAMDMPMGSTEYDSKASTDSEDPRIGGALSVLKALSAGELTLSMDSRGKISDIEVPKKVSECLKNALDRVGYAISPEDMLKLTFTSGILFLSAEPAPKGKSWIEKTT